MCWLAASTATTYSLGLSHTCMICSGPRYSRNVERARLLTDVLLRDGIAGALATVKERGTMVMMVEAEDIRPMRLFFGSGV